MVCPARAASEAAGSLDDQIGLVVANGVCACVRRCVSVHLSKFCVHYGFVTAAGI